MTETKTTLLAPAEWTPAPERLEELRDTYNLPKVKAARVAFGDDEEWELADRLAVMDADSKKLFGIHSSDYRLVPHESGLALVEEVAKNGERLFGPFKTDVEQYDEGRRMKATLTFFESDYLITKNGFEDKVNPTIEYYNSYDCVWAERLAFGAFRQVCSNGLVIGDKILQERVIHLGARPEDFFLDLEKSMEAFKGQTEQWTKWHGVIATDEHIEPALTAFSDKQRDEINEEILAEKKLTLWLFYNVLTAMITHKVRSLQRRVVLNEHLRRVTRNWPAG